MKFIRENYLELMIIIICLAGGTLGVIKENYVVAVLLYFSALLTIGQIIRKRG